MTSYNINFMEDIRPRCEGAHKEIYGAISNITKQDRHYIFFLCTCIGHRYSLKTPLQKGVPLFHYKDTNSEERNCYSAIFLAESQFDLNTISDNKAIVKTMEEYANGGMNKLIENLLTDYLKTDESGVSYIPQSDENKQLASELLATILEMNEEID